MSLLDHQELMIVKGVGPTPADSFSAEQQLTVVNLMDAASGFSLDSWTPNIPSLKSGGVWADSSISDGRTLIAGTNTNVIETITITLTGTTVQDYAAQFSKLQRMIQDARDYWDRFEQIEPVYLRWWANQAPGPQFALIYNIDLDVDWGDSNLAQATITMTIEREIGWTPVRPGGTPQEWTLEAIGLNANDNNINLRDTSKYHTAIKSVKNSQEFNTVYTFQQENFIDIPANKLPGDLPPLVTIVMGLVASFKFYISRVTKPATLPDRKGNTLPRFNGFAGAASVPGVDATFVNDATNGIIHPPVSALARRIDVSFATATDQIRMTWQATSNFGHLNPNLLAGRYRIFARMRQVGGAAGNISIYLRFLTQTGLVVDTQTINPVVNANFVLHDFGSIVIPFDSVPLVTTKGDGLLVAGRYVSAGDLEADLTIQFHALRTVAAGTLQFSDLIFMPYDEAMMVIDPQVSITRGSGDSLIYDNTGYFDHGKRQELALFRLSDGASFGGDDPIPVELRGTFSLKPGVNNRLYFQWAGSAGSGAENEIFQVLSGNLGVMINVIPRWSGIRDA